MTPRGDDAIEPEPAAGRVTTWSTGFHGAVRRADLAGWGPVSLRDVALGRRSIGAGSIADLTDLAGPVRHLEVPTAEHGKLHVGLNGTTPLDATDRLRSDDRPVDRVARTHERHRRDRGRAHDPVVPGDTAVDERDDADAAASLVRRRRIGEPWNPADERLEDYVERRLEDAAFVLLPNRGRSYAFAKRTLDIVAAVVLLALTWPIIAVLALIIRLDSPGPAIFRQTRVTRGGRAFRFYKFRTMYVDAKERFPELYSYDYSDSEFDDAFYKLADDPRNTRFGRWLRRTTLDELPNLWNVLKGDLSLVGPRPELPDLVRYYEPEELACFFTKAGLTGLAQVAGRSLLTVGERLTLDVRYIAHQTLLLDLRIIWRTVIVVVLRRGAF